MKTVVKQSVGGHPEALSSHVRIRSIGEANRAGQAKNCKVCVRYTVLTMSRVVHLNQTFRPYL